MEVTPSEKRQLSRSHWGRQASSLGPSGSGRTLKTSHRAEHSWVCAGGRHGGGGGLLSEGPTVGQEAAWREEPQSQQHGNRPRGPQDVWLIQEDHKAKRG